MVTTTKGSSMRAKWMFKQLFPLAYWTTVGRDGKQVFVIWRMWFGRCFSVTEFTTTT